MNNNDALRHALEKICAIENQYTGSDWEEIEEAREIAHAVLATSKPEPQACQACGAKATRHIPDEATDFPGAYCNECGPGGKPEPQAQAGEPEGGGCVLAGPERGDCSHFLGLPGRAIPGLHDGDDNTVDAYGKPNDWCWPCWKSELLSRSHAAIAKKDAALRACVEALETCQMVEGVTGWEYLYDIQKVENAINQAQGAMK